MSSRMEIPRLMARKSARSVSLRNGCAPSPPPTRSVPQPLRSHSSRRRVGRRTGLSAAKKAAGTSSARTLEKKKKNARVGVASRA